MIAVLAPLAGEIVALASVPDTVFAEELVGPGRAIDPARSAGAAGEGAISVLAPVDGRVAVLHPHAFVIESGDAGILVHLGIDTVTLGGGPFRAHTAVGADVRAGDPLITWDLSALGALSPLVPVIALGAARVEQPAAPGTAVGPGERLFTLA
ncbi:PTS glucose transporter subunit IIA [Pseudactinotalea sp. HY158]|uniref:PTS sugar transporter subunit IIA n=1 Tax=Pseudactinotalea sp. HY158 TaxID=2654547 RepID=UPI00129C8B69|nr:PTS glucose transporter subunit IIA [Pseudactinotalea sp. HY158]QGH70119.1 PTS glucose transporter subunit IIA [Pseudactinotalea sp. HY158]